MKILHVEMGRQLDGGARQVAYLLNGLEKFPGDHVLVCALGAEIAGAISSASVKIHRLKAAEEKKLTGNLRKIIRREKPDILHIHGRPGNGEAVLAGRLEKVAMVYTRRTDAPSGLIERFLKFPQFARIIAPSRAIRQGLLESKVRPERAVHIPCAVDTERFKPKTMEREIFRSEFGWRGDGPMLVLAASLTPHKGHSVFFSALPAVVAKYPATRVLVFGRGTAKEKDVLQREVTRRELEKYVRFEGFRADLENVLPHVDMLVHPALVEGVGVVVAEAAACGIPVVASRVGGIPDIIQDRFNGYLVTPADRVSLARHIVALLDEHDQLQQFGKTGRELMVENFSIARLVAAHRELYRSVDEDG